MAILIKEKDGLLLPLSGYKKLKAFQSGGYYWDPLPQSLIRQFVGEFLPPVEVSQDGGEQVGWFRRFLGQNEVLCDSSPLGRRSVPKEQLDELSNALKALQSAANASDTQLHNKDLISQFRLPSPEKDPELYRLRGPFWNRRLEILWGCEKAEDTSLNPSDAIALLKPDRLYTLKKWLCWLAALALAALLIWGFVRFTKTVYKKATNLAPVLQSSISEEDLAKRFISVSGLDQSNDPDGRVSAHIVDWGDGTKIEVPAGVSTVSKTYDRDGEYKVAVQAVDDLGKSSPQQVFTVRMDYEQQQREAAAERQRLEEVERAAELEGRMRAAKEAARAEAENRIVEEAADRARKEAEESTRKRLVEEQGRAEAARVAAIADAARKAEEAAALEKAEHDRLRKVAESESVDSQQATPTPNLGDQSSETNEFKDVTTGRPVRPISFRKPSYPRHALQTNQEGSVRVQFIVDTKGRPKDLRVILEKNGQPFRATVLEAIRRAQFRPAIIDGSPVEQELIYEVSFVIND